MAVLGVGGTWTLDDGDVAFLRVCCDSCGVLSSSLLLKLL